MGFDFLVTIGEEVFRVSGEVDHQGAKYNAAQKFKDKYKLSVPLGSIAEHAKSRQIPEPKEPVETTEEVLRKLGQITSGSQLRQEASI